MAGISEKVRKTHAENLRLKKLRGISVSLV